MISLNASCSTNFDVNVLLVIGVLSLIFSVASFLIWILSMGRNEIFGSKLQQVLLILTALGSLSDTLYLFGCSFPDPPSSFTQIVLTLQFLISFTLITYLLQWMFRLFTFSERLSWPLIRTIDIKCFWGFFTCNIVVYFSSITITILELTVYSPDKNWQMTKGILEIMWYIPISVVLMNFSCRLYLTFRSWKIIHTSPNLQTDQSRSTRSEYDYDIDVYRHREHIPSRAKITSSTLSAWVSGGDRFLESRLKNIIKITICYIFSLVVRATMTILAISTTFSQTTSSLIIYHVFGKMFANVAVLIWMHKLPQTTPTDTPTGTSNYSIYTPPLPGVYTSSPGVYTPPRGVYTPPLGVDGQPKSIHRNHTISQKCSVQAQWSPSSMIISPQQ